MSHLARWPGTLALLFCLSAPLWAGPGQDYYHAGLKAERLKQYDLAYADFQRALDYHPKRIRYIVAFQRARYQAALAHLRAGDRLIRQHNLLAAEMEMEKAHALDPTNFVATRQLRRLVRELAPSRAHPVTRKRESLIARQLAAAAGPEELGPVSATPVTLRLNADSRVAYQTLGRLAHINLLFDRNYQNAQVSLHLRQVSLLEALRILGIEANSFYSVITPNTIFVANNNLQERNKLQRLVLKTFYIHNLTAATDLTQLGQTLRSLLGLQHMMILPDEEAIVIRDTPDRIAAAAQVIHSLDIAPPEVQVNIRILEVSRDLVRDLGIAPPGSITVGLQTATTTPSSSSSSTTPSSTTSTPTLFDLRHLTGKNFSVSISSATLNALMSDDRTHSLQEPELRSIEGQKAVEKIGQRIPVATGSFQPGIGGVGINPLVNTQFQYQSVGVNIKMTPWIHPDNTVTLKSDIEVSSVINYTTIGGIQEPIIGQQIIQHTIELKNGESNVLGGILTEQNIRNLSGLPGFSSIPLLKWFFSSTHTEHLHDELLIVITPHIIRPWAISRLDRRAVDTGTLNDVTLHERAAAPALAPKAATRTPAQPVTPGTSASRPMAASPAQPMSLEIEPPLLHGLAGNTFGANLTLKHVRNLYALSLILDYDPRMVSIAQMIPGNFLSRDGKKLAISQQNEPSLGKDLITLSRPNHAAGISGSGVVATFILRGQAAGLTRLSLSHVVARDPQGRILHLRLAPARLNVSRNMNPVMPRRAAQTLASIQPEQR